MFTMNFLQIPTQTTHIELQICEMIANGAEVHWNEEQQGRYLVQGNQWWGYDDEKTVKIKVAKQIFYNRFAEKSRI